MSINRITFHPQYKLTWIAGRGSCPLFPLHTLQACFDYDVHAIRTDTKNSKVLACCDHSAGYEQMNGGCDWRMSSGLQMRPTYQLPTRFSVHDVCLKYNFKTARSRVGTAFVLIFEKWDKKHLAKSSSLD